MSASSMICDASASVHPAYGSSLQSGQLPLLRSHSHEANFIMANALHPACCYIAGDLCSHRNQSRGGSVHKVLSLALEHV